MKSLLNLAVLGAALAAFSAPGFAAEPTDKAAKADKPAAKAAAKPAAKPAAKAQKKAAKPASATGDDDKDLDVAKSVATEMQCAHGDKVTLYENGEDNSHIGMRWKKQLVRMQRVETSTGAARFESTRHGLVWIGIPAKGMLLDSKKGQQLANECRSPAQLAEMTAPKEAAQPQLLMEVKK
ncbi:MAG: hypothetical protein JWP36_702 [Paucimonas sp.]|nr:hypothetical protein [Paucimonas sp.]